MAAGGADPAMAMARSLVIGIGNPLRGDDGVGWRLAEALGEPHLALQQLTPDCAARLTECQRVLFVDAWLVDQGGFAAVPTPVLQRLRAAPAPPGLSHHLEPATLLWLAERLYGCNPEAWQLLVPATAFIHGDVFSPSLQTQLPQATALLQGWLTPKRADLAIPGEGCR